VKAGCYLHGGFTVRFLFLIAYPTVTLLISVLASTLAIAAPLPAGDLELACSGEPTQEEMSSLAEFIDFAEQHDGEPVFVSVSIEADSGAGGCARNVSRETSGVTYRVCNNVPHLWLCTQRDKVFVQASGPGTPFPHGIVLPGERTLPTSLPYSYYSYGQWLNYSGPFIIRYFSGTGFRYASLDIPDPGLDVVWTRAHDNRTVRNGSRREP
jgi:hypothetical protein